VYKLLFMKLPSRQVADTAAPLGGPLQKPLLVAYAMTKLLRTTYISFHYVLGVKIEMEIARITCCVVRMPWLAPSLGLSLP
jgi:hypothetical protein